MISLFKYLIPKKKETPKEPESEMGFLDHLEVLRWHIMRAVLAVVVAAIAVFMAKDFVFQDIIFAPKRPDFATYKFFCSLGEAFCFTPPPLELKAIELGEQFFVHLKVSMWLGFTFKTRIISS
jgi:sec-independent protein translocase protein TatC